MVIKKSIDVGGRTLSVEIGKVAKQAHGACWLQYGETIVLATATHKPNPIEGADFVPLLVDYRENTYAAGKFPGGFFKREGKPSEREILTSRLIDRPLRPLFPSNYHYDTQIVASVLSFDLENDPDVHGITAASMALNFSEIPIAAMVAGVRVGYINEQLVINPTYTQMKESRLNLIVAGTEDAIMMVESRADELSEEIMLDALEFAHNEIKRIVAFGKEIQAEIGVPKMVVEEENPITPEAAEEVKAQCSEKLLKAIYTEGKKAKEKAIDKVLEDLQATIPEEEEEKRIVYTKAFHALKEKLFRDETLLSRKRADGRSFTQIRPISIEVGLLPWPHGSALFTRGETQALVTCTLGSFDDVQIIDNLVDDDCNKRFMLHYNFPAFSVGEVAPNRGPGRREIGHGNLAERALSAAIPEEEKFPYTIRIVSDILESNGSSSMASVCGGCLALMDAGVPIKMPVAGVAMGLIKEDEKYAILTDIAGLEDHYGDMDFKVTGSEHGITALQMDIKVQGISRQIMSEALSQAKEGRFFLLGKMKETLSAPRAQLSPRAPRIAQVTIPVDKIKDVIGPGGKVIKSITAETKCKINVEDSGKITLCSPNQESEAAALEIIHRLTEEPEMGKIYEGDVKRIEDYGIFVEIIPNVHGLIHVSEIAEKPVRDVRRYFQLGDRVKSKIVGIDDQGKVRLSRRVIDAELPPEIPNYVPAPQGERSGRDRDRDRGGRGGYRDMDRDRLR